MASAHPGLNFYFDGALDFVAGTSDASPMMSGFIAQENAYSLSMGNACDGTHNCAPIGEVNYDIYAEGGYNESAPHYPFYDITSGCTSNDITILYGTGAWCAAPGYDAATGWGSFNALQLAWAINWEDNLAYNAPSVAFSGPAKNTWHNSDQVVSWSVNANSNPTGIAGFTQGWDSIPSDPFLDSDRNDSNSFFSGPQYPNATLGCLDFTGASCAGSVSQAKLAQLALNLSRKSFHDRSGQWRCNSDQHSWIWPAGGEAFRHRTVKRRLFMRSCPLQPPHVGSADAGCVIPQGLPGW